MVMKARPVCRSGFIVGGHGMHGDMLEKRAVKNTVKNAVKNTVKTCNIKNVNKKALEKDPGKTP